MRYLVPLTAEKWSSKDIRQQPDKTMFFIEKHIGFVVWMASCTVADWRERQIHFRATAKPLYKVVFPLDAFLVYGNRL